MEVGVDDSKGEQALASESDEGGRKQPQLLGGSRDPAVRPQAKRDVVSQHAGSSKDADAGC
jgi:hypothetical protein